MNVPEHIAIILDGNGRWAQERGMPRNYGHAVGAKRVEDICVEAEKLGVKYLTFYTFSTENWFRPQKEVDTLMKLLHKYLRICLNIAKKRNMRVRAIGDVTGLSEEAQHNIALVEEESKKYDGLNLTIAINYGSRDEIRRATTRIAKDVKEGKLQPEDIDEKLISSYLDTHDLPDPDLVIRTSGEQRISNYLLWQIAYAEFYFTDVYWPDFKKETLVEAIEEYSNRNRRFGKV